MRNVVITFWDYEQREASICHLDKDTGELKEEKVSVCRDYLKEMVEHIYSSLE